MLFTFLTTLIVYSVKKVHKTYCCSSGIACLEKRTDLILRKLVFNDKSLLYFPMASTLQFFSEDQSDQGVPQLIIKPLGISQTSKIVSVSQKNARFFKTPFYFLLIFLDNTSHISWDQSPSPVINVACRCLRQFLDTSFGVVTLPIICNIELGEGTWFISAMWTIPELQEIFPGIDLVSII